MLLEDKSGQAVRLGMEQLEIIIKDENIIELVILMSNHSEHAA
jgi:hypothetical protein